MKPLTEDDLPISFFDEIEYYHVLGKFDGIDQAEKTRNQILDNQEKAKKLPEAEKCRDHWFDRFTKLNERLKKRIEEIKNIGNSELGANGKIQALKELQKIKEGEK